MKRPGLTLDQSLQKKQNTGKDVPGGSGFSYSGLQKLKMQKQAMQQKIQQQQQAQKSSQSQSSDKPSEKPQQSSQFSYSHLKNKIKGTEKKEDQKPQQGNDSKDNQQKEKPRVQMTEQQKLAASTSQLLKQQKLAQQKVMQQALKTSSSSSQIKSDISKNAPPVQNKYAEALKKLDKQDMSHMPSDYKNILKYAMKKELAKKKMEHKIKKGEIVLQERKEEKIEIDPKLKDVRMTDTGELKDEEGNIVKLDNQNISLKVNKIKKQQDKYKELLKNNQIKQGTSKFLHDSNVVLHTKKRDKRKLHALHFIEKGSQVVEEEELQKQILDGTIIERSENDQKQLENFQQQQKRVSVKTKHHDPTPNVEWWDQFLLFPNAQSYIDSKEQCEKNPKEEDKFLSSKQQIFDNPEQHREKIEKIRDNEYTEEFYNTEKVNILVEHPAQFKNNQANQSTPIIPFFLTKQERKKIRRKKRQEKEQDIQDRIRLGLLEPPKPKAKISNMVNIYGSEAYIDPSRVESEVRKQVLERLETHKQKNQERKLNAEQRKEKFVRKLKQNAKTEQRAALFRINDCRDGQHRYKIDANAQQMCLNGVCLIGDYINVPTLVLVEGGPKAIKFFRNLMMRRIKWDQASFNKYEKEDEEDEEEEIDEEKNKDEQMENEDDKQQDGENKKAKEKSSTNLDLTGNQCYLVWEGIVKDYSFNKWKVVELTSEVEGKKQLAERGVDYYWDMVQNYKEEF